MTNYSGTIRRIALQGLEKVRHRHIQLPVREDGWCRRRPLAGYFSARLSDTKGLILNSLCKMPGFCIALLCVTLSARAQIFPDAKEITLDVAGKVLRPIRTISPQQQERLVGEWRLILKDRSITALQRDNGTPVWSAISPENFTLSWMAAEDDIAYLDGVPSKYDTGPDRLLRLDLRSGKWLAPLPIQHPLLSILPGKGCVS
jgi:hypothetical protein